MKRNVRIDYMRLISSILVVIIHTSPLAGIHPLLTYSIVDVLPRIALPFFFVVSGFYFLNSTSKHQLKQILNITKVYLIVSLLYLIFNFVFAKNFVFSIKNILFQLLIPGVQYHLWFFPTLIYSMLFFYVVRFLLKFKAFTKMCFAFTVVLYVIGLLGCSYYQIGIKIPFAQLLFDNAYFTLFRRMFLMGFPLFASGYFIKFLNEKFSPKTSKKVFIISLLLFLAEIYMLYYLKIYSNVVLTIFLYPLSVSLVWLLIAHPKDNKISLAKYCKFTSEITYYYHPMFLFVISCFVENNFYKFLFTVSFFAILSLAIILIIKSLKKEPSTNERIQK